MCCTFFPALSLIANLYNSFSPSFVSNLAYKSYSPSQLPFLPYSVVPERCAQGSCPSCPFAKGAMGRYFPLHCSTIVTKQNACSVTCKCVYISVYLYHGIPMVTSLRLQYTERIPKVIALHSVVSLPL